jgi:hypothetical protein
MLTVNNVVIVAMLVLFCRDPEGTMRGLFCVAAAIVAGFFVAALFVLPGAIVGGLTGYITASTAGTLIMVSFIVLVSPLRVWASKGFSGLVRDMTSDAMRGLRSVSRKTWMQLGACAVVFASTCTLSATGAVIAALVGPIVWAVRLAPRGAKQGSE